MSNSVTLGGDRVGSGKRQKVSMHGYESSNHDLGYVFRTTMSPGTLVPFFVEVGLPGDHFNIDLNSIMATHPTLGPLFGTFKAQYDFYKCPIRLYHSRLHNNPINIGTKMNTVKFPKISIPNCNSLVENGEPYEIQQVHPSSLLSYLGIAGFGNSQKPAFPRKFNGLTMLMYWDIVKNYYVNLMEGNAAVIHNDPKLKRSVFYNLKGVNTAGIEWINVVNIDDDIYTPVSPPEVGNVVNPVNRLGYLIITGDRIDLDLIEIDIENHVKFQDDNVAQFSFTVKPMDIFENYLEIDNGYIFSVYKQVYAGAFQAENGWSAYKEYYYTFKEFRSLAKNSLNFVNVHMFPIENLDKMRELILKVDGDLEFEFGAGTPIGAPYTLPFLEFGEGGEFDPIKLCCSQSQEGLALKTYQSDIFNNFLDSELIVGENGINEITAIDVSTGSFTIDQLQFANKIYNMMNRIVISGNTYKSYLESVYDVNVYLNNEIPQFIGGMSKELIFQEVVSSAAAGEDNPLGSLAGKGRLDDNKKGGHISVRIDEPCYIIGLVSLTPRIDYSQGNRWDVNLNTMDDLHKPALDQIGFQDLLTDQMHAATTYVDIDDEIQFKSAGKSVAWINYMTNYNRTKGNFAIPNNEMFMTLNRRYEIDRVDASLTGNLQITDLTTYVDPGKYNFIFAQTEIDAQNFWCQIGINCNVRRKMSYKVIPNL